jgi:hypothetical protein
MAITPWSWTVSNGTASASQTKAAYTALTTGGMTYNFSRYVWNDIITKINAVANALGKGWNSEYLSYSGTKMHFLYAPLSAVMFNSARYNTNYLTWTWSYDPDAKGYIGRDDFKGVADVGEKDADFVYGAYILELVERLNTVIGIINGTGQHISLSETIGCFVETAAELIAASPQGAEAGESFSIIHSGTMELEKQRSWVLHFRISMPTHKASLEIGNFSFAEASLWSRLNVTEHFRNSPSDPMKVHFYFPQDFKAIRSVLPSRPLHTDYVDGVAWNAAMLQRQPQDFGASFIGAAFSDDCMLLKQPTVFSGSFSESLKHSGVMVTERMGLFAAQMMIRNYYRASANAGHSTVFSKSVDINLSTTQTAHTGFAPIMEKDLSYLLAITSDANRAKSASAEYIGNHLLSIRRDANIAHSDAISAEIPMSLSIIKKMNRLHSTLFSQEQAEKVDPFAEMMQQQMGFFLIDHHIGYSTRSRMTTLGAFPFMVEHTDAIGTHAEFSLEVMHPLIEHFTQPTAYSAFLQSEDLPSLYVACVNPVSWVTDFSFLAPHSLTAIGTQTETSHTEPTQLPPTATTATDGYVVTAELNAEAKMLKPIGGSVLERFLPSGNAKVGYTHKFGGSTGGTVRIDISEMSCARGALELNAQMDSFSGSTGEIVLLLPQTLTVESENTHAYCADLGLVRYAYMKAVCRNELIIKAELETNGEWIYPAQDGSNLYVVQVYETDQFEEHMFFDFGRLISHIIMQSGVGNANAVWQYRKDTDSGVAFEIEPTADLNFVDASAWEYPVQNGSDLVVTQVGYMKLHQHKLEVG